MQISADFLHSYYLISSVFERNEHIGSSGGGIEFNALPDGTSRNEEQLLRPYDESNCNHCNLKEAPSKPRVKYGQRRSQTKEERVLLAKERNREHARRTRRRRTVFKKVRGKDYTRMY